MCPRCAARKAELEHQFQLAKLEIQKEKELQALRKHGEAAASPTAPVASEPPARITIKQASEEFRLAPRYLRQLIREKKIDSKKIHGKQFITRASLVAYRLKKAPEKIS